MFIAESSRRVTDSKKVRMVMLLAAILLGIKYIFVDFGIDAEFQISMAYRLATGDLMFKEMWEAYQMSAFLCAVFIKIYLALFHTTTGIVLYLQAAGVLLDGLIAYFLYRTVNKYLHCKDVAFAMAWVFFLVSPKDVPLPEYANMQLWFSMLLCLTIFLYDRTGRKLFIILSALSLCAAVLSYPSCMLLVAGAVFLFLYCGYKKELLLFLCTCFSAGILYLVLMFYSITWDEFLVFFENMLALETSHSAGLLEKFLAYLKDAVSIALVFAALYGISHVIIRVTNNRKNKQQTKETYRLLTDLLFYLLVLLLSFYTVIFWREHTRYGYTLSFLGVVVVGMRHAKRLKGDSRYFYLCGTVISILDFVATLFLTDLELVGSFSYLLIAVVAAFLPIADALKAIEGFRNTADTEKTGDVKLPEGSALLGNLKRAVLVCSVLFLVFRNVYIIRPMYLQANTILDIRGIVKEGPAIGIISEYMGPYMQNESIKEWKQYIEEGSSIWLIGDPLDTLGYLYLDTEIAAPTTVCTPGYNESVLAYWEMNPDKYPDVVIASCWYGTLNTELTRNDWIMEWIEEEFKPSYYIDGKYWRYYFR